MQPGSRLGPYEIVAPLGAGGMGEVYRARDSRLGRDVAIKVLPSELADDSDRLRRFEQEARAASALNHPHILAVFDVGAHEGAPYLVTELLEGETLRQRLAAGALPPRKAVEMALQIVHGLAAAHGKGIIHRDLKPANVFVTTEGHVKILDFGLAKLAAPSGADEAGQTATVVEATVAGTTLGTVGYMSPEQLRGQHVDQRTDIFAFGCVLYELLSGKRAFARETAADTIAAVLSRDPAPFGGPSSAVPPALEAIVRRCLEKRPEDRFSSAHDLALTLNAVAEALLTGDPSTARQDTSIVVLPFENLSPDPDNAYFADGLTEELIADLSKLRALRVISRTSAMLLKGSKKDVPTIARELNVRYVLEGSVRRAGRSLRITAQLIDAASDAHLWAEKYGGTLDDVFAIQEKVSRAIVDGLRVTLTADEQQRLAGRMIPDARAFELYLQAQHELNRLSEDAMVRAMELTRKAIDIVGPNAALYALLGGVEFFFHDQGIHPDAQTLRRAESWVARALELDPECTGALRVRGVIHARKGEIVGALRDLRGAAALETSGETLGMLGWVCSEAGLMEEARRCAAEAAAIDPMLFMAQWGHAWVALLDGDFEVALSRMQRAAEVGGADAIKPFFLGIYSAYAGRLEEACDFFTRAIDAAAGGISTVAGALRALYRGDTEAAKTLLASQDLRHLAMQDKEFSSWLASACTFAGERDEALYWLGNAIALGFVNCRYFATLDPYLAPLRTDPGFLALMERAREKQRALGVS